MKKSDITIANREKDKLTYKQLGIEVLLFMGIVVAVYLFCALVSFDPSDPGWSQTAWHDPIRNWGGAIGAYWSDIFLQFFGFIAYGIPILMALFCVQGMLYFYRHNDEPINFLSLSLRVIGCLAFLFSATGFFALNIQDIDQYQAGGILGDIVASEILPLLGQIGASIILFAICFVCITLLTGLSWFFIAEMIGIAVVFIATIVFNLIVKLFNRYSSKQVPASERDDEELDPQLNIDLQNVTEDQVIPTVDVITPTTHVLASDSVIDTQEATQVDEEPIIDVVQKQTLAEFDGALHANQIDIVVPQAALPEEELMDSGMTIDENNLPPKLSPVHEPDISREFSINADYYSPISLTKQPTELSTQGPTELSTQQSNQRHTQLSTERSTEQLTELHTEQHTEIHTEQLSDEEDIIKLVDIDDELIAPVGSYGITEAPQAFAIIDDTVDSEQDIYQQPTPTPAVIVEVPPVLDSKELVDEQVTTITKENIHDSLIHPLLQKDHVPVKKPTTPLPSFDLLTPPPIKQVEVDHNALQAMAALIEKSLADFRVKARVIDYLPGPVITRFEIELAPGVKASRISTLDRDLARSLSMPSVRVVEVIPGKPYVGIELPNSHRQTVYFREVLDSPQFSEASSPLTMVLGKDIAGQSVVADLAKMPHLLVAGTTGSGKSVGVNAMILSFLYKSQPEDVRFIMIDPKMLELSVYEGIPHLLTDVVTDMKDAANALNWCVNEMERRYRLMSALGVRNIAGYNDKIKLAAEMGRPIPDPLWRPGDSMDIDIPMLEKLPYIVVLVDEFADLIMAVGKKIEELIARLAQKARAAGIHLVLATQRPSVDVITGLIKANIPTRIAFTVSSKIDSRTILDQMGAESLLGMGDMLYLAPNSSIPIRVHGAFVRDEEVHSVVQDWKARGIPTQYVQNITTSSAEGDDSYDNGEEELDPLFDQVVAFVVDKRRASISSVQRQFRIGYNRAARIVEQMEMQGIVSTPSHNGNREVLAPPSAQDY